MSYRKKTSSYNGTNCDERELDTRFINSIKEIITTIWSVVQFVHKEAPSLVHQATLPVAYYISHSQTILARYIYIYIYIYILVW